MPVLRGNLMLGLCSIAFALLVLFVWVPLDVETGLLEKVRRKIVIGDALAPTVAALFLLVGGTLLILAERFAGDQPKLDWRALGFTASLIATISVALIMMRYAGPLVVSVVNVLTGDALEYRLLRDDAPWKYIGFFLGGTVMISGCISLVEGRLRGRSILIAAAAVVAMIAIYDLPFDDLLLPPNGDV